MFIKIFKGHLSTKHFQHNVHQLFYRYCPLLFPQLPSISSKSVSTLCKQHAEFSNNDYCSLLKTNIVIWNRRTHSQGLSPDGKKRLQWATYLSCFIGAGLFAAIGWREYQKFRKTARGMEPIEPELGITGRRIQKYRYRGYVIPVYTADVVDKIFRFQVREDDTWLVSFPKAGEMVTFYNLILILKHIGH